MLGTTHFYLLNIRVIPVVMSKVWLYLLSVLVSCAGTILGAASAL